nr:MAG TPA: hypothetical protein [Caudoviricetes sp.]
MRLTCLQLAECRKTVAKQWQKSGKTVARR